MLKATTWIVTPTDFGWKCCPKFQMILRSHLHRKPLFWLWSRFLRPLLQRPPLWLYCAARSADLRKFGLNSAPQDTTFSMKWWRSIMPPYQTLQFKYHPYWPTVLLIQVYTWALHVAIQLLYAMANEPSAPTVLTVRCSERRQVCARAQSC